MEFRFNVSTPNRKQAVPRSISLPVAVLRFLVGAIKAPRLTKSSQNAKIQPPMNILSRNKLNDFAAIHADTKRPLDAWFKVVSYASWKTFVDVRHTFPSADLVGRLIVFNLGGNHYRLIAKVTYGIGTTSGTVYIRSVMTHAELR